MRSSHTDPTARELATRPSRTYTWERYQADVAALHRLAPASAAVRRPTLLGIPPTPLPPPASDLGGLDEAEEQAHLQPVTVAVWVAVGLTQRPRTRLR